MKFFAWLSTTLLFAAVAVATEDEKQPPAELEIVTTFKPDACPNVAQTGDHIKVHYTGKLFSNGNKFDSSLDRGQPLPLTLGVGQVIKGWDDGLQGMCLNEKRTLTIPAHLAYGSRGFGSVIPPNSVLVFDVELVGLDAVTHEEL